MKTLIFTKIENEMKMNIKRIILFSCLIITQQTFGMHFLKPDFNNPKPGKWNYPPNYTLEYYPSGSWGLWTEDGVEYFHTSNPAEMNKLHNLLAREKVNYIDSLFLNTLAPYMQEIAVTTLVAIYIGAIYGAYRLYKKYTKTSPDNNTHNATTEETTNDKTISKEHDLSKENKSEQVI